MTDACQVRAGTEELPLIALHTWHGETEHYRDLAAALGGPAIESLLPPEPDVDPMPRRVEDWVDHSTGVWSGSTWHRRTD